MCVVYPLSLVSLQIVPGSRFSYGFTGISLRAAFPNGFDASSMFGASSSQLIGLIDVRIYVSIFQVHLSTFQSINGYMSMSCYLSGKVLASNLFAANDELLRLHGMIGIIVSTKGFFRTCFLLFGTPIHTRPVMTRCSIIAPNHKQIVLI